MVNPVKIPVIVIDGSANTLRRITPGDQIRVLPGKDTCRYVKHQAPIAQQRVTQGVTNAWDYITEIAIETGHSIRRGTTVFVRTLWEDRDRIAEKAHKEANDIYKTVIINPITESWKDTVKSGWKQSVKTKVNSTLAPIKDLPGNYLNGDRSEEALESARKMREVKELEALANSIKKENTLLERRLKAEAIIDTRGKPSPEVQEVLDLEASVKSLQDAEALAKRRLKAEAIIETGGKPSPEVQEVLDLEASVRSLNDKKALLERERTARAILEEAGDADPVRLANRAKLETAEEIHAEAQLLEDIQNAARALEEAEERLAIAQNAINPTGRNRVRADIARYIESRGDLDKLKNEWEAPLRRDGVQDLIDWAKKNPHSRFINDHS